MLWREDESYFDIMVACCAIGCYSRSAQKSSTQKEIEQGLKKNISFYRFPQDETLCKIWMESIGRTRYPAQKVLCSLHFTEDCFLDSVAGSPFYNKLSKTAVPTIFPAVYDVTLLSPLGADSVKMLTEGPCTSKVQDKYLEAASSPSLSNKPEQISFVKDTSEKPGKSSSSELQAITNQNSEAIRHLVSKTTSFAPERHRTRPMSPARATLIKNYKFKLLWYKRKLQRSRRQTKKLAKLQFVLKDLKGKHSISELSRINFLLLHLVKKIKSAASS